MIAKITRGSSFGDILRYATKEGKDPRFVSSSNIYSTDVDDMIKEFSEPNKLYKQRKSRNLVNPCWQCSLSLHPDENLDDKQWNTIVKAFLLNMGFDDTYKYVAIKHHDTNHEHVHIIVNRINLDGSKVWHGKADRHIANEACAKIEKGFNLHVTNHSKVNGEQDVMKKVTTKEVEKALRTGEQPPRVELAQLIIEAKKSKPSVVEFVERLKKSDVEVSANVATTGRMNGFSFSYSGVSFKGSDVGAKWSELVKELDYEQERDYPYLANIRAGARAFGVDSANSEITRDNGRSGDITPRDGGQVGNTVGNGNADLGGDEPPPNKPGRPKHGAGQQADREPAKGSEHGTSRPATSNLADQRSHEAGKGNVGNRDTMDGLHGQDHEGRGQGQEAKVGHDFLGYFGRVDADGVGINLQHVVGKFCDERAKESYFSATSDVLVSPRFVDENAGRYIRDKKAKEKAVLNMINALGISDYEISYIKAGRDGKPDGKKITFENGLGNLTALAGLNVNGHNIYIKPDYSKHSDLILVDDVSKETLEKLYAKSIPCVSVETSLDNYQVWFKYSRKLEKNERTELSRYLTEQLGGDKGAIGSERIGRLPGFTNQKEKHRKSGKFPWIGVDISHSGRLPLIESFEDKMESIRKQEYDKLAKSVPRFNEEPSTRSAKRFNDCIMGMNGRFNDASARDFAVCTILLKEGMNPSELKMHLAEFRNDKRNAQDYAERTVNKAQEQNVQAKREHEKMDHSGNYGPTL